MPVPSSYTEKSLAEYMYKAIGKVAPFLKIQLGTVDAGDLSEAVNDALIAYGTDNISLITGLSNIQKLRAVAEAAVWKYVVANFTVLYDFSADGATYNRSQVYKQARESLESSLTLLIASGYSVSYAVKVKKANYTNDPYAADRSSDEFSQRYDV